MQKIKEAIKKATSLQEVERLTKLLQSGQITGELLGNNEMDTS
jgi:U2 small nuclear ribonucleoprotein A'